MMLCGSICVPCARSQVAGISRRAFDAEELYYTYAGNRFFLVIYYVFFSIVVTDYNNHTISTYADQYTRCQSLTYGRYID